LYVLVSGSVASGRSSPTSPVSSVLVKVEPRRLWPSRQFLFSPGSEPRAALPDSVAPQSVEGRVVTEPGGWRAVVRIPFQSIGPDAVRLNPVRVDVRVQGAGAGTIAWRPQSPGTSRLALGSDNPADLGWLLFEGRAKP
jgi:hypothetical protein